MTNSTNQRTVPFWKLKTFNEKLKASIGFLKVHWKPLLKANAVIAGPLFVFGIGLLLFYLGVFVQKMAFDVNGEVIENIMTYINLGIYIFISGFLYMLSLMSITLVTYEYIRLAQDDSDDRFNTRIIFKNSFKKFWKMFSAGLLGVVALMGLSMVSNVIILPLSAIPVIGIILAAIVIIGVNLIFYGMVYIYSPMVYYESQSVGKLFGRSKRFFQKDFWQTIGMYLGNKAIQYILANGILLPLMVSIFFYMISKVDKVDSREQFFKEEKYIFFTSMLLIFIYLLVNTAFNIFHIVTSAVQYYSLKEKNDGDHTFSQIENFKTL